MHTAARAAATFVATLFTPILIAGCAASAPGKTSPEPVIVVADTGNPAATTPQAKPESKNPKGLDEAKLKILGALSEGSAPGAFDLSPGSGFGGIIGGTPGGVVGGVLGGPVGTFGTGGLGLKGIGIGGGTGEGIGLGTIGTIGSGNASTSYSGERTKVRLEAVTIDGPMLPDIVQRIVGEHQGDAQECYRLEHARNTYARGRITFVFKINAKGIVDEVTIAETSFSLRDLQACFAQVLGTLEFPPPNPPGEAKITLPIVF